MKGSPKDWDPRDMESLMTLERKKVHDVRFYNDDNGHGLTACGLRVGPWDVTFSGLVTCRKCMKAKASS